MSDPKKAVSGTRQWLKYSGMAMQMALTIGAGWLLGQWIDGQLSMEKPIFAICLVLLFFVGYMYKLIKELT